MRIKNSEECSARSLITRSTGGRFFLGLSVLTLLGLPFFSYSVPGNPSKTVTSTPAALGITCGAGLTKRCRPSPGDSNLAALECGAHGAEAEAAGQRPVAWFPAWSLERCIRSSQIGWNSTYSTQRQVSSLIPSFLQPAPFHLGLHFILDV